VRSPSDLPDPLRERAAFSVREARRCGVSFRRLGAGDLLRPYAGVRVPASCELDHLTRTRAYALRMPPTQLFSHVTAALIFGVPLPPRLEGSPTLHVSVRSGADAPSARGILGHVIRPERLTEVEHIGLRLTHPAITWCQLAGFLDLDDLIAAGDYLVTGAEPLHGDGPLSTIAELRAALDRYRGARGIRTARVAIEHVRYGSVSRRETFLRLAIARNGLPQPALNFVVRNDDGVFVAMVDAAYPEFRVAVEYESDFHRERQRFRADIRRRERLEDEGWTVVRVTADDLGDSSDSPAARETVDRIRRRMRARGWLE
jgi:very-short-patch-repair endonuclease